jgi:hypothetical protein
MSNFWENAAMGIGTCAAGAVETSGELSFSSVSSGSFAVEGYNVDGVLACGSAAATSLIFNALPKSQPVTYNPPQSVPPPSLMFYQAPQQPQGLTPQQRQQIIEREIAKTTFARPRSQPPSLPPMPAPQAELFSTGEWLAIIAAATVGAYFVLR